jgi:hypothetical protein
MAGDPDQSKLKLGGWPTLTFFCKGGNSCRMRRDFLELISD